MGFSVNRQFQGGVNSLYQGRNTGFAMRNNSARNARGCVALYDAYDPDSIIFDSSLRVALWSDKSGFSGPGSSRSTGLYLTGVAGVYASATSYAAVQLTGDLDLRVYVQLPSYNPAATTRLIEKKNTVTTAGYGFYLNTTGQLSVEIANGALITTSSNANLSTSPNVAQWLRVTRASASGNCNFYTSTDGSTWVAVGTQVAGTSGAPATDSAPVTVGMYSDGLASPLKGIVYRAQIYNGIAGTLVFDANFVGQRVNAASFTESSSNAATVTINGTALLGWVTPSVSDGLYCSGVTNAFINANDAAVLRITGDIDLRAYVAPTSWTPAAAQDLLSKYNGGLNQRSYMLQLAASGVITFWWSTNGTVGSAVSSSVATGFGAGVARWIRVAASVTTGVANFYTSVDGITWTQLGAANQTMGGVTSIFAGTATLAVGARSDTAETFQGIFYRAQVYNGIAGTLVFDANFVGQRAYATSMIESSANAALLSLNGPGAWFGIAGGYTSDNCLCLDGSATNYATTPDSAAVSITGDIDIRADLALINWATATQGIVCKLGANDGQRSYVFRMNSGALGQLELIWSNTGSGAITATSTVAVPFANYARGWVRVTLDVDNGAAGYTVVFYTSSDGVTWTQLGATITVGGVTSIFDGNRVLGVGGGVGDTVAAGRIYRAMVLNGINGTVVFDSNFATAPKLATTFIESSSQLALVTLTQTGDNSAHIAGARDAYQGTASKQPTYLAFDGSKYGYVNPTVSSYFSTPDSAALAPAGNLQLVLRVNLVNWLTNANGYLVYKWGVAGDRSWALLVDNTGKLILATSTDGTAQSNSTSTSALPFTNGTTYWLRVTRTTATGGVVMEYANDQVAEPTVWTNIPTSVTTAGQLFNNLGSLNIGTSDTLTLGQQGKFFYTRVNFNNVDCAIFEPNRYFSTSTFSASTGETWTINGSGVIIGRSSLFGDGVDDGLYSPQFSLSQPLSAYIVAQGITWTGSDLFLTGAVGNTMDFQQFGVSPEVIVYSSGADTATKVSFPLQTPGVLSGTFNGASSSIRLNRNAPVTSAGNIGTVAPNGVTALKNGGVAVNAANGLLSEIAVCNVVHSTSERDSVYDNLKLKWRL